MDRAGLVLLLSLAVAGCHHSHNPVEPDGPQPPAQVGGNWNGTLTADNLEPQTIDLRLSQIGTVVTGSYQLRPLNLTGLISNGQIDGSHVSATLFLDTGTGCQSTGTFSGSVSSTNLELRSAGFSRPTPCFLGKPGTMPQNVTVTAGRR